MVDIIRKENVGQFKNFSFFFFWGYFYFSAGFLFYNLISFLSNEVVQCRV